MPRSLGHWGVANIRLKSRQFVWIEDLIETVEEGIAGCRRPVDDSGAEPVLTVEGITKALGKDLAAHPEIIWFNIMVENLAEGYSTFAAIEWPESGREV